MRTVKGLAIAVVLIGSESPVLAQHSVKSGIEAWQRGEYATAVAIWRPLAQKGDADAQFDLGQAFRLGRGVPVDLARAQLWLQKAAIAGHLDAQTTLGLLLFDSGDRASALHWLKKAAERGEPRAMLVYGTALFNGDGVPKDPVLAYVYVSRSAAQGLQPAKATLADMDQVLPVQVRQKALAMAINKANAEPAPTSAPPAAPAKVQPKPTLVETAHMGPVSKRITQQPAPTGPKPSAISTSGGWRIQLGAFSQRRSAEVLYRKLASVLGGRQAYYIPIGSITRLQVGPYPSREAASAVCSSLRGQACFPVAAK